MGLYVYILKCSDLSYYIGVTNNPELRLISHNQGLNSTSYTYNRRPVALVWCDFFQSNLEAIRWEKQIKGWSRKKKEALINNTLDYLPEFAKCQNQSNSRNYVRSLKSASTSLSIGLKVTENNLSGDALTPLNLTETKLLGCASTPLSVTDQ